MRLEVGYVPRLSGMEWLSAGNWTAYGEATNSSNSFPLQTNYWVQMSADGKTQLEPQ